MKMLLIYHHPLIRNMVLLFRTIEMILKENLKYDQSKKDMKKDLKIS
jgi:hypothetical protein